MASPPGERKRLYTLREAARYLGRSVYSMRDLIWKGLVPAVRHNRKIWIDVRDLEAYIDKHKERQLSME